MCSHLQHYEANSVELDTLPFPKLALLSFWRCIAGSCKHAALGARLREHMVSLSSTLGNTQGTRSAGQTTATHELCSQSWHSPRITPSKHFGLTGPDLGPRPIFVFGLTTSLLHELGCSPSQTENDLPPAAAGPEGRAASRGHRLPQARRAPVPAAWPWAARGDRGGVGRPGCRAAEKPAVAHGGAGGAGRGLEGASRFPTPSPLLARLVPALAGATFAGRRGGAAAMAALRTLLRWRRRLGPAPGAQPARRLWAGGGCGPAGLRRWRRDLGWAVAGGTLAGYVGYRLSERRREPSQEPVAAEPSGPRALLPIPVAAAAKETVGVCVPRPSCLTGRRPLASPPRPRSGPRSAERFGEPVAPPGAVSCLESRRGWRNVTPRAFAEKTSLRGGGAAHCAFPQR